MYRSLLSFVVLVLFSSSLVLAQERVAPPAKPENATQSTTVAPSPEETAAKLAEQRLQGIYTRLNELGLKTGTGHTPARPILVNGKPVVALFIGDWHNPQYQARAMELIKKLSKEFRIRTLLLEGESADPEAQPYAERLATEFESAAKTTVLPADLRAHFQIEETGTAPGNYERGNYRRVLSPDLEYPQRAFGIESRNPEDLYYQMLRIYYVQAVQLIDEKLSADDGKAVIAIDGKPISTTMAAFINAHRELAFRYGTEFPPFVLDLTRTNGTIDHESKTLTALVLTKAEHQAAVVKYRERLHRFFNNYDQRVRNFAHAHAISQFFRGQEKLAQAGQSVDDIVLVMDGTAHLFSNDTLRTSHPSVITILASLGVSAGSTFAIEPDQTIDVNINPETGSVTADIVNSKDLTAEQSTPSPTK